MPIYEYECTECGEVVEHLQLSTDSPLTECPKCGGAVRKRVSAPAFQFKGTGWYVTDYGGKGKSETEGSPKDSGSGESSSAGEKTKGSTQSADSKSSAPKKGTAKASSSSD